MKITSISGYIKKQSVSKLTMAGMMSIGVLLIIAVGFNWIAYENKKYKQEYDKIEHELTDFQKKMVEIEVERTISNIAYVRSLTQDEIMNNLQTRVDVALNIAENIYNINEGKRSDTEIKKQIKEALREYRFTDPDDHVFIYTLDGTAVLVPTVPEDEGISRINIQDNQGNFVIRNEVKLLKEVDQGFLKYYIHRSSGSNDSILFKNTYVRKFKHYNWYFGSKEYLANFEERVQDEILGRLANIQFENDGYIFINNLEGKKLIINGLKNESKYQSYDNNDSIERANIKELALKGGGFINYNYQRPGFTVKEPKTSYVKLIDEWGWIIGAGFYTKDIDKVVHQKRRELLALREQIMIRVLASLILILLVGFFFIRQVAKSIAKGFDRFQKFFGEASNQSTHINEGELYFKEFKLMATSANKMLVDLEQIRSAFIKEKSLLRSLIDSMPDLVFFKDINSNYVGCNSAYSHYMGMPEHELIGKNDFDLYSKEAAEKYNAADKKILKELVPLRNEEWIVMPNKETRLFDTLKVLNYDSNGNVLGIVGVSRDITDRDLIQQKYIAAKEKAEEADRLKTAFLANMSHEIRTPMNSIVGFSNLIAESEVTQSEKEEYAGHINMAVDNLLNIINDIIDIAKIEAGQLAIKHEYFDLNKLLDDVYITNLQNRKKLNNTEVQFNYTKDSNSVQTKILADPYRLIQVLTNLIGNASKFTRSGEIIFGYTLVQQELLFFVKDTGIGITAEDQALVFKRFRQVGETNGYKKAGTGLGLAISKHIVQLMGGKIWVESQKDVGSTFYFTIPYYPLQESINQKGMLTSYNWSTKTIMIIEKEDVSFNYLKAVFSNTGTKIIRAFNYEEALVQCQNSSSLNLIYSDIITDNDEIHKFITDVKVLMPNIPIIGQINYGNHQEIPGIMCDTLIAKPVKYHLLMQIIGKYITN